MKLKHVQCLITYLVLIALEYAGLFQHQTWAMNLIKFLSPIAMLSYLIIHIDKKTVAKLSKSYKDGEHLPKWLDAILYAAIFAPFAAFGHWWLALCWFMVASSDLAMRSKALDSEIK